MIAKILASITLAVSLLLLPASGAQANDRVRIGGDVVVEKGMTVKDAVAVGGNVTVNGVVNKSAVAVGGSVFLGPDAVVRKDVVCIGGVIEKHMIGFLFGEGDFGSVPAGFKPPGAKK